MMKIFTVVLLCTLSMSSWAGDAAQLRVIGFSKAGNYLAFQEYGITDGEGATFAHLFIVDVAHNRFVDKAIETQDTSGQSTEQVLTANFEQAKAKLTEIGIIPNNLGEKMISRPFNDLGADPGKARFAIGTPLAGLQHRIYQLVMTEKEAGLCGDMGVPMQARKFSLKLVNEATQKSKILQNAVSFISNNGCPIRYRIQDVYIYHEEFIVVFINSLSPGYEGENMRHLIVTGTLN